jgi:hypothetical protein
LRQSFFLDKGEELMKQSLKETVEREMRLYFAYTLFLALFSFAMTAYRQLISAEFPVSYIHYGYGLIESMILAKIILIGQHFHLGERYGDRSLIIPTLYKTLIFSLFVLLFGVLEHFVVGLLHGKALAVIYHELVDKGFLVILCKVLVKFFAFILFFAFLEVGRVLGEDKLFYLFFRRSAGPEPKL